MEKKNLNKEELRSRINVKIAELEDKAVSTKNRIAKDESKMQAGEIKKASASTQIIGYESKIKDFRVLSSLLFDNVGMDTELIERFYSMTTPEPKSDFEELAAKIKADKYPVNNGDSVMGIVDKYDVSPTLATKALTYLGYTVDNKKIVKKPEVELIKNANIAQA